MVGKIAILALQGDFEKHQHILELLGVESVLAKYPEDFKGCSGLIIPGGESTVITRQIKEMQLLQTLQEFSKTHPVFGTCAGMIIMSKEGILPLLDISVARNAYGRQLHSFSATIDFQSETLEVFFIRAPRITQIGSQVTVLVSHENEPVLVQQGKHLAASFHPELTNDTRIHQYFIDIC